MNLWISLTIIALVFIAINVLFWRSTRISPSGNNPDNSGDAGSGA